MNNVITVEQLLDRLEKEPEYQARMLSIENQQKKKATIYDKKSTRKGYSLSLSR